MHLFFQRIREKWFYLIADLAIFLFFLLVVDYLFGFCLDRASLVFLGLTILLAATGSASVEITYFNYLLLNLRILLRGGCFVIVYFLLVNHPQKIYLGLMSYLLWFGASSVLKRFLQTRKKAPRFLFLSQASCQKYHAVAINCTVKETGFNEKDIEKNDAIVCDTHSPLTNEQQAFFAHCKAIGLPILTLMDFEELAFGRVHADALNKSLLGKQLYPRATFSLFKRLSDIGIVILLSPLWVLISLGVAALIKLFMGGPVIFSQERYGLDGKIFKVYKFRTMVVDANKNKKAETIENDPRITRLGKFLRKVRLDEFPQFWNILKGDMSLIGPRPEWVYTAEKFKKEIPIYYIRTSVRPGITGWAQVMQGHTTGLEGNMEKLRYDLFYVKYFSFWLDVKIVLKTIQTMLTGSGAK